MFTALQPHKDGQGQGDSQSLPQSQSQQPNPLMDVMLTVVLPSLVLEYLSKPERLGPMWALVAALVLPLGFGIYCWMQKRGLNFFSIFGLAAIVITGGLGLLNLDVGWFAAKEAVFPVLLGLAFPVSHLWGKPLIHELLLNPQVINHQMLYLALDTGEKQAAFGRLTYRASWGMAGASVLSAVASFGLAFYLLKEKVPASEEYVKAIGKLNWGGMIVIGVPLIAVTMLLLLRLLRGIEEITGLPRVVLMNQRRVEAERK